MADLRDEIVFGFDFGTTYSATAFTYAGSREAESEITVVKDWPGSNGITSEKVPSELAYKDVRQGIKRDFAGDPVSGSGTDSKKIRWGFELDPHDLRLRYLKLRLDERQDYPPSVSKEIIDNLLKQSGVDVQEAVSNYMSAVFLCAREAMVVRFGEDMVSTTPIKIIVTVPAVWSDAAKDATLKAAEKAGMGKNIQMISEPEAAAHYAINSIDRQRKLLKASDTFIILDCGGGTVDLISYHLSSLAPLRLEEAAAGIGALCGGAFLNLRFEDLVRARLGSDAFDALRQRKPKLWPVAHKNFEEFIKRNFNPSRSNTEYDKKKFYVQFPGATDDIAAGIEDGFFVISSAEIAEIFRPIVDSVIDLVERQRKMLAAQGKTARGVILVGGFGKNQFLYRCLKTRFADEKPPSTFTQASSVSDTKCEGPEFMILQPENPWTAVVRGAVISGLETDLVASRKARRHYGIMVSKKWDPEVHSARFKFWDTAYHEWRASNQITWCIQTGQSVPVDEPILFDFCHTWALHESFTTVNPRIIVSDAQDAPDEFQESLETRTLCRLLTYLKDVPRKHFKIRTKNHNKYRKLSYSIGVLLASGSLEFDLRVDGIVYGKVRADYE
ncbi:actin-like ATPase domain-containing protein, partial [Aureobasidium melanogenum]